MPLTEFQATLARLLSGNRTFDSYLAGGAAILIEPNTTRYSRDLDYFHDSETRVAEAFAADRALLAAADYAVAVDLIQPGYVRAVIARGGEATKVEWARDSAWRFLPTVRDPRVGYMLHPVDLAINKVLALAGRDEPRDVLDALDSVEPFSSSRPADELGCLYYSPSRAAFVDPRDAGDAVPHHGRPGGVLPRIAEG